MEVMKFRLTDTHTLLQLDLKWNILYVPLLYYLYIERFIYIHMCVCMLYMQGVLKRFF